MGTSYTTPDSFPSGDDPSLVRSSRVFVAASSLLTGFVVTVDGCGVGRFDSFPWRPPPPLFPHRKFCHMLQRPDPVPPYRAKPLFNLVDPHGPDACKLTHLRRKENQSWEPLSLPCRGTPRHLDTLLQPGIQAGITGITGIPEYGNMGLWDGNGTTRKGLSPPLKPHF